MSYHNDMIFEIISNKPILESILGIFDSKIQSEISIGNGDIDILVFGKDYFTQVEKECVLEVKSHKGLINHYIKYQLQKYVQRFPLAHQYVVCGNKHLPIDILNFDFKKIL